MAALIWATYSLLTRRVLHFDTAAMGTLAWISGLLGPGPLGGAFFLWDKALKMGDARHIGLLSYLTLLLPTSLLLWVSGRTLTWLGMRVR